MTIDDILTGIQGPSTIGSLVTQISLTEILLAILVVSIWLGFWILPRWLAKIAHDANQQWEQALAQPLSVLTDAANRIERISRTQAMGHPELAKLIGKYEVSGRVMQVVLTESGRLALEIPNQERRELVHRLDDTFDIRGLSQHSLEFRRKGNGIAVAVIVKQPESIAVGYRDEETKEEVKATPAPVSS